MKICIILFSFLCLVSYQVVAQKNNLLKKQKELQTEIDEINSLLKKNRQNTKISLNRLKLIDKKLVLQENLINSFQKDIEILDQTKLDYELAISMIQEDIEKLKIRYAQLLRYSYLNSKQSQELIYLLSAEDFNEIYKRHFYLNRYSDFEFEQYQLIVQLFDLLETNKNALLQKIAEKENLTTSKADEKKKLEQQKVEREVTIKSLQKQEAKLKKDLEQKKKSQNKIANELQRLIAESVKKKTTKSSQKSITVTSTEFLKSKGSLPWPVSQGTISAHFGVQQHPLFRRVTIQNYGIEITSRPNQKAKAVFDGKVSSIFALPDGKKAVIVKHADYYSVYANLSGIDVRANQMVKQGEALGIIFSTDNSILNFQVWYKSDKLDPEQWIKQHP